CPVGRYRDSRRLSALAIMNEDVGALVVVSNDKRPGIAEESDEPPVGAQSGTGGVSVRLESAGGDADPRGLAQLEIADEDVVLAVGVSCHQVTGTAGEGDIATVVGHRRLEGVAVRLCGIGRETCTKYRAEE